MRISHFIYILLIMTLFFFSLAYGSVNLSLKKALLDHSTSDFMILTLRAKETLQALLCGGILSVCGGLLQKILKNPIADPFILGISSGGSFSLSLFLIYGYKLFPKFISESSLSPSILSTLVGCLFSIFLLFNLKKKFLGRNDEYIYPVIGFILNSFFSSFIMIIVYVLNPSQISQIQNILFGSFFPFEFKHFTISVTITFFIIFYFVTSSRKISLLSFNDDFCKTHGLNPHGIRKKILLMCCILTSISISICGNIGFIGLICPHLVKNIHNKISEKNNIIFNFFLGSLFLMLSNFVTKIFFHIASIPLGVVTSFTGIIFLAFFLIKKSTFHERNIS